MTRQEAEALGWVWSLIGDTFHGAKVERPSASKRFPLGIKEATGVDESQVCRAIATMEQQETQRLANEALAAKRAAADEQGAA